jgi:hypothetical protein
MHLFLSALLLFVCTSLQAQTLIVWWSHNGKDIQGNTDTLAQAEYAIAAEGSNINTTPSQIESRFTLTLTGDWYAAILPKIQQFPAATQSEILLATRADDVSILMSGRTGKLYRVWVRVADASGNWSRWTASRGTIDLSPAGASKVEIR